MTMDPLNANTTVTHAAIHDHSNSHFHGHIKATNVTENKTDHVLTNTDVQNNSNISQQSNGNGIKVESSKSSSMAVKSESIASDLGVDSNIREETKPLTGKKKTKKKSGNKMLADLLAVEAWHSTLPLGGGRPRQSAQKLQQLREEQLLRRLEEEGKHESEPELTAEEIAEQKRQKEERKLKAKLAADRRKREKELASAERKRKIAERKRLIAEGIIKVESKPKKDSFYSGSEAEKLIKAASYFVNIGTKFDETAKRESKPPQRMVDEITEARTTAHRGRRLKHAGSSYIKKRKLTFDEEQEEKKKHKKKTKKFNADDEHDDYDDEEYYDDEYYGDEYYDGEQSELQQNNEVKKEPEPEPEPEAEPIWFTEVDANDCIEITDDWKFFKDFIYNGVNDSEVPLGLSSAQSFVTSNIKQYQIQHPVFKNILTQLNYPFSKYQEKYLLSLPKTDVYFNPFEEIGKMMEIISFCFLPEIERNKIMNLEDPDNCIVGRYIKAFENTDLDSLLKCITEFNTLIDTCRDNGCIIENIKSQKSIPRLAVYELLNQCYTRSVLPQAKKLSNYKAFSNEVYGELMPKFLTTVYKECGLNHKKIFIDLGSGVGNCVIQAALEFGCESYGVEIVENASRLADLQLVEFQNRCRVFGFNPGYVKLFGHQSFVDNPPVQEVIDKCDVMLVNNYLFDAKLNKKVVDLLETCKVGTKIISLKPIVPASHKMTDYNIDSVLNRMKTRKHIYGENSVSWTSKGGFYYITEVMDGIQPEHLEPTSKSRRQIALESRSRSDTPLNAFTNNC